VGRAHFSKENLIKCLVDQTGSSPENAKKSVFFLEQAQEYYNKGDFEKSRFFYNEAFLLINNLKKNGFSKSLSPYYYNIT